MPDETIPEQTPVPDALAQEEAAYQVEYTQAELMAALKKAK